jgi:hypothetical protein
VLPGVVYIGETGRGLRGRLGQLRGVFADQMLYADPDVAGPALWAMRDRDRCDFEASVRPLAGDGQLRKALEATAISLYRVAAGQSLAANFGRMPAGYRKSAGSNGRLVARGQRRRGGAPQRLGELIHRYHLVGTQQQGGQCRALISLRHRHDRAAGAHH